VARSSGGFKARLTALCRCGRRTVAEFFLTAQKAGCWFQDFGKEFAKRGPGDTQGRIWIWDKAHSGYPGHWDVQINGGADYIKVGVDGNPVTKLQ
jgi:hypothetical protein